MRNVWAGIVALVLASSGMASAQLTWIGNSAIYHVEGNSWYVGSGNWGPAFDGHDFGTVSQLTLGGEAETWNRGPGTVVEMGTQIDPFAGGAPINLTWQNLPYLGDGSGGSNDKWQDLAGYNVVAGLPAGTHEVEVFFRASNDGGSTYVWDSNGGNNYVADFTIVPEPSTLLLGAMGMVGLLIARRRKA